MIYNLIYIYLLPFGRHNKGPCDYQWRQNIIFCQIFSIMNMLTWSHCVKIYNPKSLLCLYFYNICDNSFDVMYYIL